ncbi:glycosyltransferase family 2 protein [Roseospira visakhapatnamensis]|uniref:Dolichol-phosphate mannosyltransferase n=1 Tax=Roseospira visakhapatnamensis TaxID=390880 RepID=A0A7W6WAP7_9PROT|nr:dolichol-phosphate mannosyltransferase [Roseospira visakhapatnamensis]
MPYQLAVIVPTLNERDNVEPLVDLLDQALAGESWQVVFVDDDSTDGTLDVLHRLAGDRANVSVIHRVGRRGLSSACIEGMQATTAPFLAVMDADLQHDETLLPRMLRLARDEDVEIVVASRFADGASADGLSSGMRRTASRVGNAVSRLITRAPLTDPLSGFFLLRRTLLDRVAPALSGRGFKILLDIFASSPRPPRYAELGFTFRARVAGDSKLDTQVLWEFGMLLADKTLGRWALVRWIPIRFFMFVAVGLLGVGVHLGVLGGLLHMTVPFLWAQSVATLVAMTSNFTINNSFTYRDRRLRGARFLTGLVSFYLICAIGAVINVTLADLVYQQGAHWALSGVLGAGVGAVWNYGVSATITWGSWWRRRTGTDG